MQSECQAHDGVEAVKVLAFQVIDELIAKLTCFCTFSRHSGPPVGSAGEFLLNPEGTRMTHRWYLKLGLRDSALADFKRKHVFLTCDAAVDNFRDQSGTIRDSRALKTVADNLCSVGTEILIDSISTNVFRRSYTANILVMQIIDFSHFR